MNIHKYRRSCTEEVNPDEKEAIVDGVSVQQNNQEAWVEALATENVASIIETQFFDQTSLQIQDKKAIAREQNKDPCTSLAKEFVANGRRPTSQERKHLNRETSYLLHQWKKLVIIDDVLYRTVKDSNQVVLPKSLRSIVYTELHDKMGHLSQNVL